MGGIMEVYLANREDITEITIDEDMITAITPSSKFKKYQLPRETGSLASTWTIDPKTGTRYVSTDLVLIFNRMDTQKRVEISALAQNELVAIVKDNNGSCWYLGYDEPLYASAGDGLTGAERANRNGYSITLHDNSKDMPYEVDADIVDALVA